MEGGENDGLGVSYVCYVFFSLRSSDLPSSLLTRLPRTPPHITVLVSSSPLPSPCPLRQHLPSLYFLRHPWTPNSLDLWIFPGSPLDLPFVSQTPVSGSFLASPILLLLSHLHLRTPASQSPYLASIFDPLYHHWLLWLILTLSSSSFLLIELYYDSFPMTHSFFHFVYKPLSTIHVFLKLFLLSTLHLYLG